MHRPSRTSARTTRITSAKWSSSAKSRARGTQRVECTERQRIRRNLPLDRHGNVLGSHDLPLSVSAKPGVCPDKAPFVASFASPDFAPLNDHRVLQKTARGRTPDDRIENPLDFPVTRLCPIIRGQLAARLNLPLDWAFTGIRRIEIIAKRKSGPPLRYSGPRGVETRRPSEERRGQQDALHLIQ